MNSKEAFIALNMIDHVGPVRVRQLLELFGTAPAILRATRSQLLAVPAIGTDTADALVNWEKSVPLAAELQRINADTRGRGLSSLAAPDL
jgi:DNA processing protein